MTVRWTLSTITMLIHINNFLTLLSLVKAQTTLIPTATCVAPTSGLGESTTVQEVPDMQIQHYSIQTISTHTHIKHILSPAVRPAYLWGSPCWRPPWRWAAPPTARPRSDPRGHSWSGSPPREEKPPPTQSPRGCGDRFPLWTTPGETSRVRWSRLIAGQWVRGEIYLHHAMQIQSVYQMWQDCECVILLWAVTRSNNNKTDTSLVCVYKGLKIHLVRQTNYITYS